MLKIYTAIGFEPYEEFFKVYRAENDSLKLLDRGENLCHIVVGVFSSQEKAVKAIHEFQTKARNQSFEDYENDESTYTNIPLVFGEVFESELDSTEMAMVETISFESQWVRDYI